MNKGEMAKSQALNISLCFARPSLLCAIVLVPSLGFICFLSFDFFPFLLTISILILSPILLLTNKKQKVSLDEKQVGNLLYPQENQLPDKEVRVQLVQEVENENDVGDHELLSTVETEKEVVEEGLHQLVETVTQTAQQSENGTTNYEYQVEHFDVQYSDSEFSDESSVPSESFGQNWMCPSSVSHGVGISDGCCSDSDDDNSLIEINLPGSELVGEPKEKLLSKFPDFLPADSMFRQQGLRELLADINEMGEEENLIEIDISMGSIKCPRFEIQA